MPDSEQPVMVSQVLETVPVLVMGDPLLVLTVMVVEKEQMLADCV